MFEPAREGLGEVLREEIALEATDGQGGGGGGGGGVPSSGDPAAGSGTNMAGSCFL
jgi:hypothetical protein